MAEIRHLFEQFPEKKECYLEVESFNLNKEWVFKLCEKLKEFNDELPNPVIFGTNIRITPNADFENIFNACAKANIRYLTVGLESGSERIRREIMNRIYSNDDVIKMAEMARKYGLKFGFQNMIGLPTETEADFMQTVALNRICQPYWYNLSIFYPYPGTKLAKRCIEMGLLSNHIDMRMERHRTVIKLPTFPEDRIKKRFYLFDYDVYKGEKALIIIMATIIRRILFSHPTSNRIYRLILMKSPTIQNVKLRLRGY